MIKIMLVISLLSSPTLALAWEGFDYDSGTYIEIEKGNLVRQGRDIEIFDYDEGAYKDVEVESIHRSGQSVEVEIYDYSTGEYRNIEME